MTKFAACVVAGGVVHSLPDAALMCESWGPYFAANRVTLVQQNQLGSALHHRFSNADLLRTFIKQVAEHPDYLPEEKPL